MSDAAPDTLSEAAGRGLPLFYRRVEALEAGRHAVMGLSAHDGFAFAARANAAPLNVTEFARAAVCFPIVFAGRDAPAPVAVLGLRRDENLLVGPDGMWEPGAYVPAYLRRYPFILTRPEGDAPNALLCVDADCPRVVDGGEAPFFDGDEPSETSKNALEFCLAFQRHAAATERAAKRLRELDLLSPQQGKVEMADGEALRLTDFHVVDEKKLNALSDEQLLSLRADGALAAAYCQMVSMNNWSKLARLAETRKAA